MSELSAESGFGFTTFGTVTEVNNRRVDIPDDRRADFARAATYFSGKPNTTKLSMELPSESDANELRKQLQSYADEKDLSLNLPRFVDAHRTADKTDAKTGKVTPGKDVEANKVPRHYNTGRNVTFRFAIKRDEDRPMSGPVTTIVPASAAKGSK
jgi:hypothetical protein